MKRFIFVFLMLSILICAYGNSSFAESCGPWDRKTLSSDQLRQVIDNHKEWLIVYFNRYSEKAAIYDSRRANLCGADLHGADLRNIDLSYSVINKANLSKANLSDSNFTEAYLGDTDLSSSIILRSNFTNTHLSNANLSSADIENVNLNGTYFYGANLTKADFIDPKITNMQAGSFLRVKGLSTIYLGDDIKQIVELRKLLKDAGFKSEVREITSALAQRYIIEVSSMERLVWTYLFGGLLTNYGAFPYKALIFDIYIILLFAIFYLIGISKIRSNTGILCCRPKDRVTPEQSNPDCELLYYPTISLKKSIEVAFLFSFQSAFHFGWHDLNVGLWINRLQRSEYTLKATGCLRTMSGIQALISLYLIALFFMTYFGSLFE